MTLNTSEFPNDAVGSSLSQVLQTDPPPKYYLSPKACEGILRRSERRGKTLPPTLKAALLARSAQAVGGLDNGAPLVLATDQGNAELGRGISPSLTSARGGPPIAFKTSHYTRGKDGPPRSDVTPPLTADADMGDQDPVVFEPGFANVYAERGQGSDISVHPTEIAQTLDTSRSERKTLVYVKRHRAANSEDAEHWAEGDVASTLNAHDGTDMRAQEVVLHGPRRLTPLEQERLQGFPDGWTEIDGTSDSARRAQLGNAVTVDVAEWIGNRIMEADQ